MMKKIALVAASALLASAFVASSASAQVAAGNYRLETQGIQRLRLQQSTVVNCRASLNLTVSTGGTSGSITGGGVSAGDLLCGLVTLTGFSWPVSIGAGTFTVTGAGAQTILGTCTGGQLNGTFSGNIFTVNTSSGWTSNPPQYTCSVTGPLTLVPVP